MSYHHMVTTLRDELVRGGEHRRRRERRRTVALASVLVIAAVTIGGVVWRFAGSSDVDVAGDPSTSPIVAACNAAIDAQQVDSYRGDRKATVERFAELAVDSGDPGLVRLGTTILDKGAGSKDAYLDALNGGFRRCRKLRAPGYVPTYVDAPLGPVPNVALESYGQVVTFDAFDAFDSDVPTWLDPIGHDLSPVEIARIGSDTYVARWTYTGSDATRRLCTMLAGPTSGGSSCYRNLAQPPFPPTVIQPNGGSKDAALALVRPDVAFVVVDSGTDTYVQRPAANMVAVPFPPPVDVDATATWIMRAYDANGVELGCSMRAGMCPPTS